MAGQLTAEDIDRIDRDVGDRFPYPLVGTYNRALFQTPDPAEAHEYLLDLFEVTLKYLAAIAIAQYLADGVRDAQLDHDLRELQRPSLGHWQGWLRDTLRVFEDDERRLLASLRDFYRKRHEGAILTAAQGLSRSVAAMGAGSPEITSSSVTTQQLFDVLVAYRNRLAHGARPSSYDRTSVADMLAPALRQLYGEMGFAADFRLVYVRAVAVDFDGADQRAQHRYRHLVTSLMGESARASMTPRMNAAPYPDRQLYLLDRDGDFTPLLSIHPFLVFAHCASCNREQAFVLNSSTGSAQDYLSYGCTHHVRSTDYLPYMQRLLKQLEGESGAWEDEQRTTKWELLSRSEGAAAHAGSETAPPAAPAASAAGEVAPSPSAAPPPADTTAASGRSLRVTAPGQEMVITADRTLLVGRDQSADVRYEDPRVSRRHASLSCVDGTWAIEDLNSHNGTFLDGARIGRHEVKGRVTLRLGDAAGGPLLVLAEVDAVKPPSAARQIMPAQDVPHPPPASFVTPAPAPAPAGASAPPRTPVPPSATAGPTPAPLSATAPAATEGSIDLGSIKAAHRIRSQRVALGRATDNDIVLTDPSVSRHHAEIRWDPAAGYQLRDLGSHNGTYVNGQYTVATALKDMDLISIGRHRLRLVQGTLEEYVAGDVRIELNGVTVHTPEGRTLLDHVSFALEKQTFLAVVGPSGAGKTTLVNAMTGFHPADEGHVFYGGRDLYAEYDDLRRGIGYVPQDDIIHTQLTARQALTYTAALRFPGDVPEVERRKRVEEVMAELGLAERADLPIDHLSGGQRKRANIGVELLTKPSPLFLDEPTSGLDPGMEKGVMTMLRGLADGGRTVIIVTHSQQSLHLCDRVLFLAPGGRTAYFGPPADALRYFNRTDFADVFTDLEQRGDVKWDELFRNSPEYEQFVRLPLAIDQPALPTGAPRPLPAKATRRDWPRQSVTLLRRYMAAVASDRRNLALLLLQAPVLALLMIASLGSDAFSHPNVLAQMVVTVAVITVTLTGLLNSIREIVKEFPIYQRERFVGLSIRAYIISKLGVLAPLTVLQALILVVVGLSRQPVHGASALGSSTFELVVDVGLAGLAAMSLGLMVSAMMRSADKAISVLVLLVVAQLIMSIPVLQISDKPVLGQLSWLSSAKWGVDAVASTVSLNDVQPSLDGPDAAWKHDAGTWLKDVTMLVVLTVAPLIATAWLLKRRDPSLLTRRRGAVGLAAPVPRAPPPPLPPPPPATYAHAP